MEHCTAGGAHPKRETREEREERKMPEGTLPTARDT